MFPFQSPLPPSTTLSFVNLLLQLLQISIVLLHLNTRQMLFLHIYIGHIIYLPHTSPYILNSTSYIIYLTHNFPPNLVPHFIFQFLSSINLSSFPILKPFYCICDFQIIRLFLTIFLTWTCAFLISPPSRFPLSFITNLHFLFLSRQQWSINKLVFWETRATLAPLLTFRGLGFFEHQGLSLPAPLFLLPHLPFLSPSFSSIRSHTQPSCYSFSSAPTFFCFRHELWCFFSSYPWIFIHIQT